MKGPLGDLARRTIKHVPNRIMPRERVFFWHIAKCGGTSLRNALEKAYRPWNVFSGTTVHLREGQVWAAEKGEVGWAYRRQHAVYCIASTRIRMVMGHFKLSEQALEQRGSWRFITILRDPVDRYLSHYHFNTTIDGPFKITKSLEEFVHSDQGRRLGGLYCSSFACGEYNAPINAELLDRAVENAQHFDVIGRIENIPRFTQDLHDRVGLRLKIPRSNIGRRRKTATPPSP